MPTDPSEQAAYYVRHGKMDEAIALYEKLAAEERNGVTRHKELMWALWQAQRYQDTANLGARLARQVPQDIEVLNLWARAQAMLGKKQAAAWTYEKSLAVNPDQLSVRLAAIRLRIDLKDLDSASQELNQLLPRYPQEPNVYANLAQIAFLRGDYDKAQPLWAKAISLAPDNLLFRVHDAETDYHRGQMSVAHAKLKKIAADIKDPWPAKERRELWALLETVPALPGEKTNALQPYEHPLGLDEVQIGLTLGHLYSDLRDYDAAADILLDLEKTHKSNPEIYSRLARQYYLRGRYSEAAHAWSRAAQLAPEDIGFQFEEARSLYYSGKRKAARAKFQDLALRESNAKWRAIDFLTDISVVNNDFQSAQEYLEGNISELHRPDEPRFLRLASIYAERGQIDKALSTIDAFVKLNPHDGRALMFKGDILAQHGRTAEAMEMYRRVLELNPAAVRVYFSLADAYNTLHDPQQALATIEKARAIDPTDPYLLIWQARYLYDIGNVAGSNRLLRQFLKTTPRPAVPAVLYHGLSAVPQDPMLAYSVHISTTAFDDQMQAIAKAGYQPVTAVQINNWMLGKGELPAKPIFISFDDARLDAFRHADPILSKYGLKATMFVPLISVDKNLPGYASWDQLKAYQKNGRWEMQAHGDLAHKRIPVDSEGRSGLYLLNQQWLAGENKYESLDQWIARVAQDHDSAKLKMRNQLGITPVAFAYPEGDFGQMGLPSSAKAAQINLAEATKAFGTSYHQDVYGINIRTRDPQLLTRVEPRKETSGAGLVRSFAEKSPFTFAKMTLLRQATWQGNVHSAQSLLEELKREPDLSPRIAITEEARIRYAARDLDGAEELLKQAEDFGETYDLQSIQAAIDREKRFVWNPNFLVQSDDRHRDNWMFHQTLSTWGWGSARWSLHQLHGVFKERDTPTITQDGIGFGASTRLGLFHTVDARVLAQFLSGGSSRTTYTGAASLRSQWTDQWSTGLEAARSLYTTARALNIGTAERSVRGSVLWENDGPWQAKSQAKLGDLTDGNQIYDVQCELTRQIFVDTDFRVGYHFETEHMDHVSPDYYSPQHLVDHQAILKLSTRVPPGFYFDARYLPGYGKEDGTDALFINEIELALRIPLGKQTMLSPQMWLNRTPTYQKNSFNLALTHRF